jgi:SNF2-related domain
LLVARVPLRSQAGPEWPKGAWQEVGQIHERATFRALSWLLERIKIVDGSFAAWQEIELPKDHSNCERCAPTAPSLRWIKRGKKAEAIEDSAEAGEYERRLKRRPAPFVTQLRLDDNGVGTVRIGVNVASLTHRAFARLPKAGRKGKPTLSWRLNTNFKPLVNLILPKFNLLSNRPDPEHQQPPHFEKFPLRVEQLRSLHWMLEQEKSDAPPFIEEEVSEAMLDPLGWRAEGRAQQPVHIRGGVLADQVGYGKTAITLGLIDCTRKEVRRELEKAAEITGKIRVKASLVIVPPHLTRQWSTEIQKFVSPKAKMNVVTIITASNLNPLTVEKIVEADIVVVASNLFKSAAYLANLEAIAAGGSLPATDDRYFKARLDTALESLKGQVDRLREEGSVSVMDAIHAARKRGESVSSTLFFMYQPLPRRRGREGNETIETHERNSGSPRC